MAVKDDLIKRYFEIKEEIRKAQVDAGISAHNDDAEYVAKMELVIDEIINGVKLESESATPDGTNCRFQNALEHVDVMRYLAFRFFAACLLEKLKKKVNKADSWWRPYYDPGDSKRYLQEAQERFEMGVSKYDRTASSVDRESLEDCIMHFRKSISTSQTGMTKIMAPSKRQILAFYGKIIAILAIVAAIISRIAGFGDLLDLVKKLF
jgi:hypothetical protein